MRSAPTRSCCSAISPPATNSRGRPIAPEDWAKALAQLRAPLGVHAVLGNHDWWDDLAAQRKLAGPVHGRRVLEKNGIPVYENAVVRLAKDGQHFWLAGLGDQLAFIRRRRAGAWRSFQGVDDLAGTLGQGNRRGPGDLARARARHLPARALPRGADADGHTHGGQVRLFGYSPMVPSRFGNRFAYGHIVENNRHLIVSGGLGCSILPVRMGVPPEIVLVDVAV